VPNDDTTRVLREVFRRREIKEQLLPSLEKLSASELAKVLSEERVFQERFGIKFNDPDYCREIAEQVLEAKKIRAAEEANKIAVDANEIAMRANTHSWIAVIIAAVGLGVSIAAFLSK
jgi:hypothetical protein